jgi:thioredoxin 1
MAEIPELTDTTFDEEIGASPVPVVVDFWAAWCGPCHLLAPILEQIAIDRADDLRVFTVDADAHPTVAARYGVMSLPTLLVFDGRQGAEPVMRLVGARGKRHLMAELDDVLGVHQSTVVT